MTLPVSPPERTLHDAHLMIDHERRRQAARVAADDHRFGEAFGEPVLDSKAPLSVDADTGTAVAELQPVDIVPLSTAISRYTSDG